MGDLFRCLVAVVMLFASLGATGEEVAPRGAGEAIYMEHCASCHGEEGEGVDEEYDEALWGDKSLESLTRYIHKSMPEDEEELVVDEDAAEVARYVYEAFYSPAAQARIRPPRVELLRMTNEQYRQSVADLLGSFGPPPVIPEERGLKGRYFNSEKMAKHKHFIVERVDPGVDFDFGKKAPVEEMTQQGFAIRWEGSLIVPDSGSYEFRLRTHNGAMLHLNGFGRAKDEDGFIDAYVSTGNVMQEKTGRMTLLGGRAYPLRLEYFSYQEKRSSIHLEWKRPHGVWEAIPRGFLSPRMVPPVTVVQARFSADDRSLGYERGSGVSGEWQEATTYAAIDVVNHVVEHLAVIAKVKGRDAWKLRIFCEQFAERAFRRPLTAEQRKVLVDDRFGDGADPETAMKESMLLVLCSPHFLYPGLADNEGGPDSHAVAARLALVLWDSLPDRVLWKKAKAGKLGGEDEVRAECRRMMADPRARYKVRTFFQHWLAMDEREDLGKDPELYPGFDQRIVADLRHSLESFVEEVVWGEGSDYRQLLLADYVMLNPRLARYYEAEGLEKVGFWKGSLVDGQRSGIFTHPYLLSANAYHDNTSPIHRGVFLSRNVLGRLLKPPPEAVAFKNDEFDPTLTMREKVTELTKKDSCMQCHRVINPIGFSLESFDAVGRFRTRDNRKPVNTVSDYVNDRDEKVRVESAKDLAELAVGSEAAQRAFITHLFHHLTKQPAAGYGDGTLERLRVKFVDSGYNIRSLIVEISSLAARHHANGEVPAAKASD